MRGARVATCLLAAVLGPPAAVAVAGCGGGGNRGAIATGTAVRRALLRQAAVAIVLNLVVELLYGWLDPRVRLA